MSAPTPSSIKCPIAIDAELAVMTELMAVTYNLDKAKSFYSMDGEGFGSGAAIAVQGVGPMGLLHVFKARIMGAGDIIALDRSDFRLEIAKRFGADHTINVTRLVFSRDRRAGARPHRGPRRRSRARMHRRRGSDPTGIEMVRRGGMYIVAGVFADVGAVRSIRITSPRGRFASSACATIPRPAMSRVSSFWRSSSTSSRSGNS